MAMARDGRRRPGLMVDPAGARASVAAQLGKLIPAQPDLAEAAQVDGLEEAAGEKHAGPSGALARGPAGREPRPSRGG
jgi:hypothetical protein